MGWISSIAWRGQFIRHAPHSMHRSRVSTRTFDREEVADYPGFLAS
jgi:hypothetical protein